MAAAPRRQSRLRRIALYGASRGVTEGLLGTRGLVLAALLGPEAFGGWALFRLAMRYATSAGLGVNRGLERELSQSLAETSATERADATLAARSAVGFKLLVFGVLSLVALGVSFRTTDAGWTIGLRGFSAALITSQLVTYGLIHMRAAGDLRRFAVLEILNAAFHVGFATAGAVLWGLPGAFGGFVLASVSTVALFVGRVPFRPALSLPHLRRLLRIGLPVSVTLATGHVLTTADRLVVAAIGGTAMLGYYAFGVAVAGMATAFAWVIRTVVFPDVYRAARAARHELAVRAHLHDTVTPFALLYPPLLGALALAIGPAVQLIVPQYASAVAPARLFIFAGATLGFVSLGSLAVVAADRQRLLPLFSGLGLVMNLSLATLALRSGLGLEGVAAGALASQAVYGTSIIGLAAHAGGIGHPVRFALARLLPLVWCVAAMRASVTFVPGPDVSSISLSGAVYALLVLPLLLIAVRRGDGLFGIILGRRARSEVTADAG